MHDTTVDRVTDGRGLVSSKALKEIRKLDGAHWFSAGDDAYRHTRRRSAYRFRGVATGKRRPPKGATAADFRVTTLPRGAARVPAHTDQHRDQGTDEEGSGR